jgi:hypothetical protein
MSSAKFYNFNLVRDEQSSFVSVTSENAFFPISNLKDDRTTKVFRSVTGITTTQFVIDMLTNEEIDAVLLTGSVLEGLNVDSVTIEANNINDWTSPPFTETLDLSQKYNIGHKTFAQNTYRFWRITAENSGGNYVEIGNIFIGKATTLTTNNIDFGWDWKDKDISKFRRNRYKQKFWDLLPKVKELKCNYKLLNLDEFEIIKDMVDANGRTVPVWVFVDDSGSLSNDFRRFWGYMTFKDSAKSKNVGFQLYDVRLSMEGAQ